MKRKFKAIAIGAAVAVGAILGSTVIAPPPADAAGYIPVCGSGYTPASRRDIPGGTAFLAGNGSMRCAITVLDTDSTTPVDMSVWVRATGSSQWKADPGKFRQYAGPVFIQANSAGCADYGGRIRSVGITAGRVCW